MKLITEEIESVEFLIEQTTGIENALREGPPPVAEKDIERVMQKINLNKYFKLLCRIIGAMFKVEKVY